jgi:hypothetical protein
LTKGKPWTYRHLVADLAAPATEQTAIVSTTVQTVHVLTFKVAGYVLGMGTYNRKATTSWPPLVGWIRYITSVNNIARVGLFLKQNADGSPHWNWMYFKRFHVAAGDKVWVCIEYPGLRWWYTDGIINVGAVENAYMKIDIDTSTTHTTFRNAGGTQNKAGTTFEGRLYGMDLIFIEDTQLHP